VHDSLTVPRFNTNYGKNAITHRGPILWNTIIAQDKDFVNMNYKDLANKIHSIDIFKEVTFKETSVTMANAKCTDFKLYNFIGDFKIGSRVQGFLLCIYFV